MSTRNAPTSSFIDPPDTASYDALTDLFLGEAAASPGSAPVQPAFPRAAGAGVLRIDSPVGQLPSRAPTEPAPDAFPIRSKTIEVEALVMGHLPVRANPWASQYARAAADRAGEPIALLRLLGGEAWIDLFGVPPAQRESHARETLSQAIEHAAGVAAQWLVQCDENDGLGALPLALSSRVTLLCAGNEAALLAAFQSLKSLSEALPPESGAGQSAKPPVRLRVGVMGADEATADSIAARLRQSADMFLKRRVDAAPSVNKMGPTGGAPVFRGGTAFGAAELIARARASRAAEPRTPPAPAPAPAGSPAMVSRPRLVVPAPFPELAPPRASETPSAPRSTLAQRIPGLIPLNFICPDDATVEFARDASGTLHLLRSGDNPDALRSLTASHAWARKNAALLAMVSPGLNTTDAAQHLFTSNPKADRTLLDSSVRIHLLASVEVEGKLGWCCVELN